MTFEEAVREKKEAWTRALLGPTQPLFPTKHFKAVQMERNPFEDQLMETLRTLDAIDKRLSHKPGSVWPKELSEERNWLVWHAFDLARELDYKWGVGQDPTATCFDIVVYIYVPINGVPTQLSWHVPSTVKWDGHTREEKTARIAEYTKDLP